MANDPAASIFAAIGNLEVVLNNVFFLFLLNFEGCLSVTTMRSFSIKNAQPSYSVS